MLCNRRIAWPIRRAQTRSVIAISSETDLRTVFHASLPERIGAASVDTCVMVAFMVLDDWLAWLSEAASLIDARERARAQRCGRPADRQQLTIVYALHRLLLGVLLRCDAAEVPLGRDVRGCPRLADDAVHTSLSHADGFLALAVSTTGPIGIDIELARRAASMLEIADRVCHPGEARKIASLDETERGKALLEIWVRKEAVLKAAGIGLAREMSDFPLVEDGPMPLPIAVDMMTRAQLLDVGSRWIAAIAAAPDALVESAWVRPTGARGPR